jgi:cell division protein FtsB
MASEQFHEKEVEELRQEMEQQKTQIEKLQRGDYHRTEFEASKFGVSS